MDNTDYDVLRYRERRRDSQNAFNFAEESLDILRIVTPTSRLSLPQFAIQHRPLGQSAFIACIISWGRYPYAPRKEQLIKRLTEICVKPKTDLEKRIKDALHFFRIAEYHSPNHQKVFFYVAAIERLILSGETSLTHKFRERGSILLENDVERRLECSEKLKALYSRRSAIAHGEKTDYDFYLTQTGKSYLYELIMKMLYLIDKEKLQKVGSNRKGDSLEEYLDRIIFSSQSPSV